MAGRTEDRSFGDAAGDPTPKDVIRQGARDAVGLPAISLVLSMTGFGSLARESGLDLSLALVSTAGVWGLPGQLAMVELYASGAGLLVIVVASSLANARFLPMAAAFLPTLRPGLRRPGWLFLLAHCISLNTWAAGMRVCPGLRPPLRHRYFTAFFAVCLAAALAGTVIGYLATGTLPRPVTLGLVFLNPVFFALLLAAPQGYAAAMALVLGALIGPPLHIWSPDWGVPAAGLIAGTATFLVSRRKRGAG